MSNPIRLAGVIRESIVDGPGIRFVVFVQGCPHHCEGCHNPESHDFSGGYDCDPEKILAEIKKNPLLDGVTFSGGEPLCQAAALLPLAKEIKKLGLNLFIYTGSIFEDLLKEQNPDIMALLQQGDFLVDGPFVLAQRDLTLLFRGSQNQRILDLPSLFCREKRFWRPSGNKRLCGTKATSMFCLLLHARKFCFFSEDKNCGKRRHLWQESVFSICNPHL